MTTQVGNDLILFKVLKFDGTDVTSFCGWKIKVLAYTRRKKFKNALSNDWSNSTNDDQLEANDKAIGFLIGSLSRMTFTLVITKTIENTNNA